MNHADSDKATSAATASATPSSAETTPETLDDTGKLFNDAPAVDDFSITLKTTSKQCFGSAGCNVTVEPALSYTGAVPLDPDKSFSLTYEVRGGEDGAVIDTLKLSEQTTITYQATSVSTPRSGTKLSVEITAVEALLS
ncbi:hypothetical protein [Streptomyces sp. NPDC047434]|uniref:hypothetical protein n=1 Tax=Streptomyces sp. NPDC047434 TaxID=3155143 RepID=UPI0033C4208D